MRNLIKKFRQSSIVFEKPRLLFEIFDELQLPQSQYFLLKLRTRFLVTNAYKSVLGIFLFSLDLELFAKIKKASFLHTRFLDFY